MARRAPKRRKLMFPALLPLPDVDAALQALAQPRPLVVALQPPRDAQEVAWVTQVVAVVRHSGLLRVQDYGVQRGEVCQEPATARWTCSVDCVIGRLARVPRDSCDWQALMTMLDSQARQ